ncbi:MAG: hypothetical protein ABJH06_14960, partial [Paraglaciecola sp.]|uniref:hypothetical protein n=1 Tax=Paraglaciecola sp. TaxID=1920173 RepID=UPI00329A7B18
MDRSILLPMLFVFGPVSATPSITEASPATFIMQVTSNLSCETLDIELISRADNTHENIRFESNAYSAVELPSGAYEFGDVICMNKENAQTLDLLNDKIAPINLTAGQAYYAGRLIFQEVVEVEANGSPNVLSNCPRIISRARDESSNACHDGIGVDTLAQTSKAVNVYLPEVKDEDIALVREALFATESQLLYLPL